MNFFESIKSCFIKYTDFSGRSMRSEYWNFAVFIIVLSFVADFLDVKICQIVRLLKNDHVLKMSKRKGNFIRLKNSRTLGTFFYTMER